MSLTARRVLPPPAPWLKDALWRQAQAVPSLDLRFADKKSLVDSASGQSLVTFSRASSATFVGSDGVLQTATNDVPRFDHNPTTRESLGLLVEEPRTNSIRNNTMVGAVAGTPGTLPTNWFTFTSLTGLTRQIVATGTENGVTYIEIKLSGTPSSAGSYQIGFEGQGNAAALTGQSWAQSVYLKLQAGNYTGISATRFGFNEFTAVPTFVTFNYVSAAVATSAELSTQRQVGVQTLNGGATTARVQPFLEFTLTGTAIDITLRIGLPQLEQGAFATSVIPTTTAAATRAADVASITGSAFSSWYRQDEGTIYIDHINRTGGTGAAQVIVNFNNGGADQQFIHVVGANILANNAFVNNVSQGRLDSVTPVANTTYRAAVGYGQSSRNLVVNGLAYGTNTGSTPAITQLAIGQNGGSALNGTIRRLTFFPARLPNTTLQRITQ